MNSKEYEWSDVHVVMMGREVTGIRGIQYDAEQEKTPIYGRGNKPRSIQKGNKSYSGTITILQSELEALQLAAGKNNSILDLPAFDVVNAYAPESGGTIITDIVKSIEITKVPKGMKQNDPNMEIELPFVALDIQYNV